MTLGVRTLTVGSPPFRTGREEVLAVPASLASVSRLRRFVQRVLEEWQHPDEEEAGSLLVSELASNAVRHAGTAAVVCLSEIDGGVLLEVTDGSSAVPLLAPPSTATVGGRGLRLLDVYSVSRGVEVYVAGKSVWAVLSPAVGMPPDPATALLAWGDAPDEPEDAGAGDGDRGRPVREEPVERAADLAVAGRYLPAGAGGSPVAGDFYDVLPTGSDLFVLVVADVSGHGTPAAARMRALRAATRRYALGGEGRSGPGAVLRRLDAFLDDAEQDALATLWYGEYQPSSGQLTYASAGHPPPVLACEGEPVRLLEPAGAPPLGAGSPDAPVVEHRVRLPPGAVLVAYSDGLVDRAGADLDDQLVVLQRAVAERCDPVRGADVQDLAGDLLEDLVPDLDATLDDVCLLVVRRQH